MQGLPTSKELAPLHSVKNGILQNACSTSPRMDADLEKSALICTARLKNSPAKGPKRMVTKVQWLCWKLHDNRGLRISRYGAAEVFIDFAEELKHTETNPMCKIHESRCNIRDQNPSLGMICPGETHQRNPNAPKFEDRSQEETEWQEQGAREAAWRLAKSVLKLKEKTKPHSSRLRKIGACLHQIVNLRNENLLSTLARRCIWSAKRTWILLKWIPWRSRVVLR